MIKPSDFDSVSVSDFRRVPAGGYVCKIMNVDVMQSKTGKDMVVVSLDIAEGDLKDEFATRYKHDSRADKKWGCTAYVLCKDNEGNTNRDFKRFVTSFEESNKVKIDWTDDKDAWNKQFKGKRIGVLFREEEYEYNGDIKSSTKPFQFRKAETIQKGEFDIPKKKEIAKQETAPFAFEPINDDVPF